MNHFDHKADAETAPSEESAGSMQCRRDESSAVYVVVCTYQGRRHVRAQVRSLLAQTWPVRLLVVDDASSDDTRARIRECLRAGQDRLHTNGSNIGYVRNFERSIGNALDAGAAYIALSDQDDVWSKDRISNGMQEMRRLERRHGSGVPLLVHSDLQLISDKGDLLHSSYLRFRRYRLSPARDLNVILGENGVMGNTILMNRALARLALPFPPDLHVHDYWLALLAELFGSRAMLVEPQVDYRLHQDNASNTRASLMSGCTNPCRSDAISRWLRFDFKLPFKEDSRLKPLEYLLSRDSRLPILDDRDRADVEAFVSYLRFEQPRLCSLHYLLRSGVIRTDLSYRLRLCLVTLFTRRYTRSR